MPPSLPAPGVFTCTYPGTAPRHGSLSSLFRKTISEQVVLKSSAVLIYLFRATTSLVALSAA